MMTKTEDTNLFSMVAGALCALLLAVASTGCIGDIDDSEDPVATGDGDNTPPPGDGDGDNPDNTPPPPQGLTVSGMVMDYASANAVPPLINGIDGATVETAGITPLLSATTDIGGAYSLLNVPPNSIVNATVLTPGDLYRPTFNNANTLVTQAVADLNFYGVTNNFVNDNTLVTTGAAPLPLSSVVFADMIRPDGSPMTGVPLANVTLTHAVGAPVGAGPYFFDPGINRLDPLLLESPLTDTRLGFVNVPTGQYTLTVLDPGIDLIDPADDVTYTVAISTADDGATLTQVGELVAGGGPPPPGPIPGNLTFTADIYPLLQATLNGGDGCADCHTAGGVAEANIQMDLAPEIVYNEMLNRAGVIVALPDELPTLPSKPLYEDPPNHANATYPPRPLVLPDPPVAVDGYDIMMAWIEQGYPL